MSNNIKNDLINWKAEQLSDDSPVYNSKDLINALNSIMPSLGSVILTTNNHVLSKQEDWDSITMNTLNMFTTLANSGLPANDFPNNSGILLVLGYTSYNIYIAISGTAVYYRLGDASWNKLLTSETIKDLTGSVATLTNNLSKLSDQQTTLNNLFNTFKDGTTKQLDTLNAQSTSQSKMLDDINNQLVKLSGDYNTVKNAVVALDELKNPIPVDDSIIIGKPVPETVKNALDNMKSSINQSKFNLLFFNDSHYGMRSAITNYGPLYGIDRLNGALYMDDSVDVIVAGGDNIDGHLNSTDGLMNDEQNFALELLFGTANHADKFALRGNHDDGTLRLRNYRLGIQPSPDYFPTTISRDDYKQHFMTSSLLFNEHRDKDSTYFYKDYPDKKVRLIGLDSNDTPEDIKSSDGGVKYIGISNMGYRQEQLDWLANVALQNVPEDYATIVVVHAQATPTAYDDTDLSDGMKGHHTNQAQVVQILNDFKNGQSSVVTNSVKDWEVNVKTNFVTQGKRDLVAWIHGHLHYEEYTTSNGFNDISCISSIDVKGFQYEDDGGWTLFTLDPVNRKLIATGYGLGTNRTFTY